MDMRVLDGDNRSFSAQIEVDEVIGAGGQVAPVVSLATRRKPPLGAKNRIRSEKRLRVGRSTWT